MRSTMLIALAVLMLAAGCSKDGRPSIIGHWRAERVQMFSANLPIGPDIEIKADEITSPSMDLAIPVKEIESKGDEVIVDIPYGVGLSFYFDGPDRIYLKLPLLDKIYYRRVKDDAVAQAASVSLAASGASQPPAAAYPSAHLVTAQVSPQRGDLPLLQQAEQAMQQGDNSDAQTLLTKAQAYPAAHPAVDYDLAVLAARRADGDAAISHLNDAFKQGFRQFAQLDATRDFDALHTDVRYQALVARYK